MSRTSPEKRKRLVGHGLRWGANGISASRLPHSLYMGKKILDEPDYHSWKLAGNVAGAACLDKVDGWMGRAASKMLGVDSNRFGEFVDQLADKSMTHVLLGAMTLRALMNGDQKFAKFLFANQVIVASRDIIITNKRREADKLGIPTKAQPLGKYKTGITNLALAGLCSPPAASERGKMVFSGILATGTGMSAVSGYDLNNFFNEEMALRAEGLTLPESFMSMDKGMPEGVNTIEMMQQLLDMADQVAMSGLEGQLMPANA